LVGSKENKEKLGMNDEKPEEIKHCIEEKKNP